MSDVVAAAGAVADADAADAVNTGPTGELHGTPLAPAGERPSWLPEKFETPEALAESYTNLEAKLRTKTDDLREEVRTSMLETDAAEAEAPAEGVPEAADGYSLPEGMEADEALLGTFQEWAFERGLGQDDFEELANFYASSFLPDVEAEAAKVGPERISELNRWIGANVPEDHYDALRGIMTTAANVEALEALMKLTVPSALPGQDPNADTGNPAVKTKDDILKLMGTPGYMDQLNRDPKIVKEVDDWFAANAGS